MTYHVIVANLRYNPSICLEGLRKITTSFRILGPLAEISTPDILNMKQKF
jgi:hypothetical protein